MVAAAVVAVVAAVVVEVAVAVVMRGDDWNHVHTLCALRSATKHGPRGLGGNLLPLGLRSNTGGRLSR